MNSAENSDTVLQFQ